jgi:hypothetical protein
MHRPARRQDTLDGQASQVRTRTVRASRSHAQHDHKMMITTPPDTPGRPSHGK